ncbi:MAG: C4-type zinc ribbon domain-containing protein [Dehalococcoidia bacterium]|nr:C4-type zinc ribbon domain-containing protein [Dehalococcoidia bacterium]
MNQIKQLYELQELDRTIAVYSEQIRALKKQLGETETVVLARKEVAEFVNVVENRKKCQHDLENEISDLQEKIKPLHQKLFGGGVKNPKELVSLQEDYDHHKAQVKQREDLVLEAMLESDEMKTELVKKEEALKSTEADWKEEQDRLNEKIRETESNLSHQELGRENLVKTIEPSALKTYEALASQKTQAIAKIERGMCQGCRVTLPVGIIQKARAGTELVYCSNCLRVLFVE